VCCWGCFGASAHRQEVARHLLEQHLFKQALIDKLLFLTFFISKILRSFVSEDFDLLGSRYLLWLGCGLSP
jgi:hypothetical protein